MAQKYFSEFPGLMSSPELAKEVDESIVVFASKTKTHSLTTRQDIKTDQQEDRKKVLDAGRFFLGLPNAKKVFDVIDTEEIVKYVDYPVGLVGMRYGD